MKARNPAPLARCPLPGLVSLAAFSGMPIIYPLVAVAQAFWQPEMFRLSSPRCLCLLQGGLEVLQALLDTHPGRGMDRHV